MSQRARPARHAGKLMIYWMAPTHRNGNYKNLDLGRQIILLSTYFGVEDYGSKNPARYN